MSLTEKQKKWIITHFKNTKNDEIMQKVGITHSALHRFAREHGLKKTKQFQRKCQLAASQAGRLANKKNNWPPKGYVIPKSRENCFKPGVTPEQRLGKKRNQQRIMKQSASRKKLIAAEKRRVLFGLDQKTKLKVVPASKEKVNCRYNLRRRGYIVSRGAREIFYNEKTNRSPLIERNAIERHRFILKEA
jgi:hypothetical protein